MKFLLKKNKIRYLAVTRGVSGSILLNAKKIKFISPPLMLTRLQIKLELLMLC